MIRWILLDHEIDDSALERGEEEMGGVWFYLDASIFKAEQHL